MEQEFKKNRDLKDMDTVFENTRAQSTEEKADVPDDNVKDPTQVGNYTADNIQILEDSTTWSMKLWITPSMKRWPVSVRTSK